MTRRVTFVVLLVALAVTIFLQRQAAADTGSVSYTHLTLPTSDLV